MIPVILVGSAQDCSISEYLRNLLDENGGVLHISGSRVCGSGNGRFLLLEYENLPSISLPGSILILKQKSAGYSKYRSLAGDLTGVVDSSHTQALDFLKRSGIPVISCGMSPRDTLTLSSITESSVTVTLTRSLQTLSGDRAEPQEFPCPADSSGDDYAVMAGAAVLLLSN